MGVRLDTVAMQDVARFVFDKTSVQETRQLYYVIFIQIISKWDIQFSSISPNLLYLPTFVDIMYKNHERFKLSIGLTVARL
jgi:hypothetical protein